MSMDEEPTIIALTIMDGSTLIQTTYDPMQEVYYTEVYCVAYHRQFITATVSTNRDNALRAQNYWVGVMAADAQPSMLRDVVSLTIYPRRW